MHYGRWLNIQKAPGLLAFQCNMRILRKNRIFWKRQVYLKQLMGLLLMVSTFNMLQSRIEPSEAQEDTSRLIKGRLPGIY